MDYHAGFMLAESMNPCPYAFHNHSCSLASERGKPKPDSWADTNINLTVRPGKISCNIIFSGNKFYKFDIDKYCKVK
jgi:hypothetical protein